MKFAVKATILSILSAGLLLPSPAAASWYEEGEVWAGVGVGVLVGSILTQDWDRSCRPSYPAYYEPQYAPAPAAYGPEYSGGYYEETRVWPFYRHVEYQAPVRLMPSNPAPQSVSMAERRAERAYDARPMSDDSSVTREENTGYYETEQIAYREAVVKAEAPKATVRRSNAAGAATKAAPQQQKAEPVPAAKLVNDKRVMDVPAIAEPAKGDEAKQETAPKQETVAKNEA